MFEIAPITKNYKVAALIQLIGASQTDAFHLVPLKTLYFEFSHLHLTFFCPELELLVRQPEKTGFFSN